MSNIMNEEDQELDVVEGDEGDDEEMEDDE